MKKFISGTAARFVVSGGINTLATYLIYLGAIRLVQYQIAYTLTYACGIVLGYFLNALWVFRSRPTARSAMTYPLAYIAQYLLGLGLLSLCVAVIGIDKRIAPLIVVAITLPFMFALSRLVFKNSAQR